MEAELPRQIEDQLGGEALPGIDAVTSIGVRVPVVFWPRAELDAKIAAYPAAGCREAILVELDGRVRYFGPQGERTASAYGLRLTVPAGTYPRA